MAKLSLLDLPGLRARESAEPGFAAALAAVADRLGLSADYIGAVMSLESGYDPHARNPHGGAIGLIQFMPATAQLLGTTAEALAGMTAIEQLPFVEAFYRKAGRAIRPGVPGDYYMATFLPAFVGKDPSFELARPGNPIYDQNAGLDTNKDGVLTVGDVTQRIDARVAAARARPRFEVDEAAPAPLPKAPPASVPAPPAVVLPSPSSAPPALQSSSFGQLSVPAPVRAVPESHPARELVVFSASVELAEVEANAWTTDRLRAYWRSALLLPDGAHVDGYLHLAWCGVFALWALHEAELCKSTKWQIGRGFIAALELPTTLEPKPGDIAYSAAPYQHHAIVVSVDGDHVHTIDGNQGQTPIKFQTRERKSWTAFYSIEGLLT